MVLLNILPSLLDEHHAWHFPPGSPSPHPPHPTRPIRQGSPGSGQEFFTFHRYYLGKFHRWYDFRPGIDLTIVYSWSQIPAGLKDPSLGWNQNLANIEDRVINDPGSFASADELGIYIEGSIHGWLHNASASFFREPILANLHSPESSYFYQLHGLVDRWWWNWEHRLTPRGVGDHFYTTSAAERDNAIASFGYQSEGTACYVFDSQVIGNGEHFYTISPQERDNAIAKYGYEDEGTACYVFDSQQSGTVALYRLFSPNSGDHFYTTSAAERDNAIASFGYQSEGTACYVFDSQQSGTVAFYRLVKMQPVRIALYRLLNPNSGDHFYTTSAAERDNAVSSFGYRSEGTACYVYNAQISTTRALYRLLNPNSGDHFYTTSEPERDNAVSSFGYYYEGIACYIFDSQQSGTVPLYRLLKTT